MNQLYFHVKFEDNQTNQLTKLLEHYRLRKLENMNQNPIDRSEYLLKSVCHSEGKEEMDFEESRSQAMNIDWENWKPVPDTNAQKNEKKAPFEENCKISR